MIAAHFTEMRCYNYQQMRGNVEGCGLETVTVVCRLAGVLVPVNLRVVCGLFKACTLVDIYFSQICVFPLS